MGDDLSNNMKRFFISLMEKNQEELLWKLKASTLSLYIYNVGLIGCFMN